MPGHPTPTQVPARPTGMVVGASMYGGPTDPGTPGSSGSCGDTKGMTYAELGMGQNLGGLPCGTPLVITHNGHSVTAHKEDIGLGGASVNGHSRDIDLWYETAAAIGFNGTGLVTISRQDGQPIKATGGTPGAPGTPGSNPPPAQSQGSGGCLSVPLAGNLLPQSACDLFSTMGGVLKFLTSESGWLRMGKVIAGGAFLMVSIDMMMKGTTGVSPINAAKKAAVTAAVLH